jgi:hypothetical protein
VVFISVHLRISSGLLAVTLSELGNPMSENPDMGHPVLSEVRCGPAAKLYNDQYAGPSEAMRFQLVVQFRPSESLDFERLVSIEDALISELGDLALVDGHDMGSGEFNIFILTDNPVGTFQCAQLLLHEMKPVGSMNVAYRDLNQEDYVIVWPPNLNHFSIV